MAGGGVWAGNDNPAAKRAVAGGGEPLRGRLGRAHVIEGRRVAERQA